MALTPAIADAYRNITISNSPSGILYGGNDGTATAKEVGGTFNIQGGFGITLVTDVSDPLNPSIQIVNTGNGTGALTTITDQNTSATYYPIFTRAPGPGDINIPTGTYQMDTMYLDQTTTPMTYNPNTGTLTASNFSGAVAASTFTANSALVGTNANFTDWPNATLVSSQANSGDTHTYNIGIVGEAVGDAATGTQWGVGVYGKGSTNVATRSSGILGDGGVTNSSDTASAIGVRGYATDTHAGGLNIGLYGEASNGLSNYALYMSAGNILSVPAQTWTLVDNNASALSFDAAGKTGILVVKTTNAAEGVTMSGTLGVTGHVTVEGVTSTGATGTGKFVFDTSPEISGATISNAAGIGFAAGVVVTEFSTDNTLVGNATDVVPTESAVKGYVDAQHFYIGTTDIAINRASGVLTLSGVTSEKATNIVGGNSTTLLGSLPYQSNTDATSLLAPNTSTTRNFLRMTGTGTNGAAPSWDTVTQTDVGLSNVTNESKATMFTDPTFTGKVAFTSSEIALGSGAGATTQGLNAIAIGKTAGGNSQGNYAIAIGAFAGTTSQHANTIVLNAYGSSLETAGTSRFYVDPIRNWAPAATKFLYYDTATKEITTAGPTSYTADFGTAPISSKSFVIPVSGVSASNTVMIHPVVDDEWEMDPISYAGVCSTDAVTIYASTSNGPIAGTRSLRFVLV